MESDVRSQPEDEGASRRQRILDAAAAEFSRKGFSATRIDAIAKRADANKQLIYYYFGSKSGLYEAVLDKLVETYRPLWKRLESATVEELVASHADHSVRSELWRRLLAWEGIEYWDGDRAIHLEEVRTQAYKAQTDVIARSQASGRFPQEVPPQYASLFVFYASLGPTAFPQITKMVTGLDPADPELHSEITRVLQGLIQGFAARQAPE